MQSSQEYGGVRGRSDQPFSSSRLRRLAAVVTGSGAARAESLRTIVMRSPIVAIFPIPTGRQAIQQPRCVAFHTINPARCAAVQSAWRAHKPSQSSPRTPSSSRTSPRAAAPAHATPSHDRGARSRGQSWRMALSSSMRRSGRSHARRACSHRVHAAYTPSAAPTLHALGQRAAPRSGPTSQLCAAPDLTAGRDARAAALRDAQPERHEHRAFRRLAAGQRARARAPRRWPVYTFSYGAGQGAEPETSLHAVPV